MANTDHHHPKGDTMTPLARIQARSAHGMAGKRAANSAAWLRAFERRAYALLADTSAVRAAMAGEPGSRFSDPRYERGTSVNATDIRASRAWVGSTGHQTDDVTIITGLPAWLVMALDTDTIRAAWPHRVTTTSMAAGGTGSDSPAKRRPRKSKTGGRAALRAARLRDAAGTIRMGEQD